jgi:hypothetical protein
VRRVATFVLWWFVLFWAWLAYEGEWNRIEWVAAAGAATFGAALATGVAALGLLQFRVPLRAIAAAWRVPLQSVIDFGIVTLALWRRLRGGRVRGRFVVRPFRTEGGGAVATGERAWRATAATYSPNAYVVDIDPGERTVLLHDLIPNRRSEEPA